MKLLAGKARAKWRYPPGGNNVWALNSDGPADLRRGTPITKRASARCLSHRDAALTKVPKGEATMAALEVTKKLLIYHTLYRLNVSFSNIVTHCRTLREAGVLTAKFTRLFQGFTQELQAEINDALLETIHKRELNDWAEFGKIRAAHEKRLRDPDDVLLDAEDRKRELRKKSKGKP
jgi:hypothetical protein